LVTAELHALKPVLAVREAHLDRLRRAVDRKRGLNLSTRSDEAAKAAIGAAARELRLPTIRAEANRLAEIAIRERQSYLVFLAELLAAEVDDRAERRRARRITEAKFRRMK
jgi:hypothetical protein